MKAVHLKTEFMENLIGIDIARPYLSWICQDGKRQSAYEIEAISGKNSVWKSGKVYTSQMHAIYGNHLKSRQNVTWRVRLWDEKEEAGEWSEPAMFEMGLLKEEDFQAKWINPELECNPEVHKPASYLKTSFDADKVSEARLYITCHGLYDAYLNGERVGSFVLAPGTSSYDKSLSYQTYDVTRLLKEGKNEVMVILGDGWYRSCSGVDGDRNLYGEDVALYFQLEADGQVICISDENWMASQNGPLRENDMQQGETYNALLEEITEFHAVKTEAFGVKNLVCSNSCCGQAFL